MNVRPAQISDLDTLFHLMDALIAHEQANPSIWRYTEEQRQQRQLDITDAIANPDHALVIAETENEIVGFAHGIVHRRTTHTPPIVGMIGGLYVTDSHRRRGIGRRLVNALCQFFANTAVQDVSLRYVVDNPEAEGFWTALGFKPVIITANIDLKELQSPN